jgi:pimeloyl-ACP methyl ester carboxylesterase
VLEDPVPLLGRLVTPTLLLWGEKDTAIPFSRARDFLAALPNATLAALPDLGHVPQEEAPAESLAPVRAFLAR